MDSSSKQFRKRNAILDCLKSTKAHPSAEMIFEMLQADHPDISMATVYRNLNLFKNQGIIVSVGTVDGMERYDYDTSPHVHFICTVCSDVADVPGMDPGSSFVEEAAEKLGCSISSCRVMLQGVCRKCRLSSSVS